MATKPEEAVAALQQKNLESAMRLAQLSIDNSQRILQLQVEVAREIFEGGVASAKALAAVKSPQEAVELRARYAQQTTEKMLACSQNISSISSEMQGELGKLMSDQLNKGNQEVLNAMQQMFASMPFSGNAAAEALQHTFETARKTLEQVSKASSDAFASFTPAAGKKR
jgi:phasin family protein